MVPEKQQRYDALIRKVRESYADNPGGLSWCDDCQEINLWTYWQGRNCGKVKILLVGQDWGSIADGKNSQVIDNVRKINEEIPQPYLHQNTSPTDLNLIRLFQTIGYDITNEQEKNRELFFTNFVLGYRESGNSRNCQKSWFQHDEEPFRELLELLEPEYVFCLGQRTYEAVMSAVHAERPRMVNYHEFIRSNENPISISLTDGKTTHICALAHCGKLGTLNRNLAINNRKEKSSELGLDKQVEDWAWVMRERNTKKYAKLVRDRIPEIIEADGKTCVCRTLSDEEYLQMLDKKLNEELSEYQESKSLEELADLLEVMHAVVKARGWTMEQLEEVRAEKAAKRGGFEKKILLQKVME